MLILLLTTSIAAIVSALVLLSRRPGLVKGWQASNGAETITLTSIDTLQVITTISSILLKYIPGTIGYRTLLTPDEKGSGFRLPLLTLSGPIKILAKDIDAFKSAVKQQQQQQQHTTTSADSPINCFLLLSFTTPLLLFALANHACPIRPLGSVNTQNRFEFEDADFCRDSQAILSASQSGELTYTCSFGGDQNTGKRHKRGVEFDIIIEVKKSERTVLRQHLSFLQFLPSNHSPKYVEGTKSNAAPSSTNTSDKGRLEVSETEFKIESQDTLRWAASCGDYNPIHVSMLGAKLFGFRSPIAHGNHGVALAVQTLLEEEGGEDAKTPKEKAANYLWSHKRRLEVQVKFVKPMSLPAFLTVRWSEEGKGVGMEIVDNGRSCVVGQATG